MIAIEDKREFERNLQFTEYLASFWNYEAVKKIQEKRDKRGQHNFMSDEEFEKSILNEDFKNNPWIDKLKKIREYDANLEGNDIRTRMKRGARMVKAPTDLSYLASLTEED